MLNMDVIGDIFVSLVDFRIALDRGIAVTSLAEARVCHQQMSCLCRLRVVFDGMV